jgi:signal transduction histidine kinase/ligand-binding sensor domain-containing protein/DNA-binding response OmpR family regulator
MSNKTILTTSLLALSLCANAQFNMLFTSDSDLPNSLVNKVEEDKNGMIWVATEDGLCRYNGSRFVTYRNIPSNPRSLSHNFIRTVCADSVGNVVIGTIGGVQVYNIHTDDFSPRISAEKIGVAMGNVNSILRLADGEFFIGGIDPFTLHINSKGEISVKRNAFTGKTHDVHRSARTPDGKIWVSRQAEGVMYADKDGKIHNVRNYDGSEYNFSSLCVGHDGKLYAGDVESGLYFYNARTKHFDLVHGTEGIIKIRDMKAIPNSDNMCIATDGNGVMFFNIRSHQFVPSHRFDDPFVDISSQKAHSLYVSKHGDIWMALYQKGVFMASHSSAPFGYIGRRSQKYDLIGDRCVTSIIETKDRKLWISTDNGGLYGITPDFQNFAKFRVGTGPEDLPPTIQGLFCDSQGRLWFGSYNRGCGIVNTTTGKAINIPIEGLPGRKTSVYGYAEDKRGTIWAATMGQGIFRYDASRNIMTFYTYSDGTRWTNSIFYDSNTDRIYTGTYDGIVWFKPNDAKKTMHRMGESEIIYSITRLNNNTLGFATSKGVTLLDTNNDKLRTITKENGLPNSSIYAVQMGNDGHLWLSTSTGLIRFNLKDNTSETFTARDGLQGNEFYKNAGLRSHDGRLWFGGINGITFFYPNRIKARNTKCTTRVVALRANERFIGPNNEMAYELEPDDNTFIVEFAALPLYMTHRIAYSYKLDDGNWETLPIPQNRVVFNGVSSGSHVLYTKTIIDGHDSEVTETNIHIAYPWYLRWWSICIWLIILASTIYMLLLEMRRRRKLHRSIREHQREEEAKEHKLQFFMNIVHDLRTPITLISTPLQKLLSTDHDEERQRLYGTMSRNADRLLRLTDQIMDLRKIDRGKMELTCTDDALSPFVKGVVSYTEDIAQSRRQTLTFTDKTNGHINVMLDTDCFEKILLNLLSNALKYTPENGSVTVSIDLEPKTDLKAGSDVNLILDVVDTGIGIPDEEKRNIFTRFYQVRTNGKFVKGTGIGLNLVKALVELHKGTISVCDNPAGKGTKFTVVLPLKTGSTEMATGELLPQEGSESIIAEPSSNGERNMLKSRKTVLIVDDDDEIRSFLCEEMALIYNVIDCADGKTAYQTLNKERVDIVVSDIMMPEIDGIELCRLIRQNVRISHLPIILLTAKGTDRDRIEGLQATADAYVTKPFNLALLQTLISNLLLRQEKLRNTFKGNELPTDQITTPEILSADEKLLERLMKCINDNLDNPDLTSEYLASEVGLSRVHLYRKLKELTNQSATNYIRNIRLTKAAELLRQKKCSISEVAYLVGYRTPNHFSTAFKELYGVSPSEYVKEQ